jgi:NADH-quinone oxidoreductase subunit E
MTLSQETRERILSLRESFPERRSPILPALRAAQEEVGYLPPEVLLELSELLGFDASVVEGVASFYSLLYLQPVGRHILHICNNLSCYLAGSDELINELEERLGISVGGTTPDGRVTLRHAECLAACDRPVAVLLDGRYVEGMSVERLDELLEMLDHE